MRPYMTYLPGNYSNSKWRTKRGEREKRKEQNPRGSQNSAGRSRQIYLTLGTKRRVGVVRLDLGT